MTLDILMPFYGRVDQFRLAVESVRDQSDSDWRLVIVDDVYPDLSAGEWARELNDPRITYLRNEQNLGVSGNFNRCVALIENDFAVIMGCDDVMRPGYVARVAQLRSQYPAADLIQPGVSVIDHRGEPSEPLPDRVKTLLRPRGPKPKVLGGDELAASLLRGNWCYFPSLCWRSDRLREFGFREDRRVVQDLTLIMQIVLSGGTLVLDDETVFDYRRHAASVSSQGGVDGSKFAEERDVFYEAADRCDALGWHRAARVARRHVPSRLNALSELPAALLSGDSDGRRALLRHVLGGR
ncbi:glycosyltransferase family 2 protein [Agreia pratensis]|uniref:Glycosyltransferase, GT2 family n=1 Tax=Agreia pratensis TaxID=150121 RepID=A0A1X7IDV0_9MICO|nr:glycosyltransferase family 2 protein [Agreia pratensis]SMG12510.1 Glycosyltransferase, GT2 family [Agreia pratensis]